MPNRSQAPADKTCERCGRRITWRKKWARDWDQVRYCSQSCRSGNRTTDAELDDFLLTLIAAQPRRRVDVLGEIDARVVRAGLATSAEVREQVRRSARRLSARGLVIIRQGGHVVDASLLKGDFSVELATA